MIMRFLVLIGLSCFLGCNGGGGASKEANIVTTPVVNSIPVSQIETQAILQSLKANPDYQLTQVEVQALEDSRVLSAEEKALLNNLQIK